MNPELMIPHLRRQLVRCDELLNGAEMLLQAHPEQAERLMKKYREVSSFVQQELARMGVRQ